MKKSYFIYSLIFMLFLYLPVLASDLTRVKVNKNGDIFYIVNNTIYKYLHIDNTVDFEYYVFYKKGGFEKYNTVINCKDKTFVIKKDNKDLNFNKIPDNPNSTANVFYEYLCNDKQPIVNEETKSVDESEQNKKTDNKMKTGQNESSNITNNDNVNETAKQAEQEKSSVNQDNTEQQQVNNFENEQYEAQVVKPYLSYIQSLILYNWQLYPINPYNYDKIEIKLVIDRQGHILSTEISKSLYYRKIVLDINEAITRSKPFSPIVSSYKDPTIEIILTFEQKGEVKILYVDKAN